MENKEIKRKSGYYWVKMSNRWKIVEWLCDRGGYWWYSGKIWLPNNIKWEIDEKRIVRK